MIYIAVLNDSTIDRIASEVQNFSTILPLFTGPYSAATVRRFSMKALARYQQCRINYSSGGLPEPGPLNSGGLTISQK